MQEYNRNHFITVIDDIMSTFFKGLLPLIIIVFAKFSKNGDMFDNMVIKIWAFVLIICLIVIYYIIEWYKKSYCITDNMIMITEGVFVTKRREVPFNKIQTVNITQNIKQRMFKIACLKIDTGNSSINDAEVNIVIKSQKAEVIRNKILNVKDNSAKVLEQNLDEIKASNKDLFIAALTDHAWFAGIATIFVIYQYVDDYLGDEIKEKVKSYVKTIDFKVIPAKNVIIIILSIIFIYLVCSIMISMVKTFVKFYDFSLKRDGENIVINYGLFEKKNYAIPVNRISAVYIKQSLFRQLLGLREMHIESVGYGDENGESSMLFPIVNFKKQEYIIKNILPEFYFEGDFIKTPLRSLKRFINYNSIIIVISSIVLSYKFKYGYLSFLLLPIFIFKGYREYKNSGIYINDKLICLSNKGFNKEVSIIPLKRVQSIEISQNPFQKRAKVFNFEIFIQGNTFGKGIKIKNFSEEFKSMLSEIHIL